MSDDTADVQVRRSRVWLLIPFVVFFALSALFYMRLTEGGDPSALPSVLLNKPVPEFTLGPLEGLTSGAGAVPGFSSGDLTGKVSLVNVWASWCGPCRAEHPVLMDLAERDDLAIFGINYKDDAENARRFLGSLGNPYEAVGTDDTGRASIDWGVYGVPETYVVDARGCIVYKHVGPLSETVVADRLLPMIEQARTSENDCRPS